MQGGKFQSCSLRRFVDSAQSGTWSEHTRASDLACSISRAQKEKRKRHIWPTFPSLVLPLCSALPLQILSFLCNSIAAVDNDPGSTLLTYITLHHSLYYHPRCSMTRHVSISTGRSSSVHKLFIYSFSFHMPSLPMVRGQEVKRQERPLIYN